MFFHHHMIQKECHRNCHLWTIQKPNGPPKRNRDTTACMLIPAAAKVA
jgi:hypothetical protein